MRTVSLTCAETQIFVLYGRGLSPRRIAEIRGVSVHTIKTHMKNALRKTGAHSSAALAVAVALRRKQMKADSPTA